MGCSRISPLHHLVICTSAPELFTIFSFINTLTTVIYSLSLHDALPISVLTPPGRSPMPAVAALSATGEQVVDTTTVAGPASDEETALLADWLERPGTRLIECDLHAADGPGWSVPVHGAQHHLEQLAA